MNATASASNADLAAASLPPIADCTDMAQVRAHIDALDARIAELLAQRCRCIAQAARIKQHAHQIVDLERVEAIVARTQALARAAGAPPEVYEATWRALIEASIAYEWREFERLHGPQAAAQGGRA